MRLIDDNRKAANLIIVTEISAVLRVLIEPLWRHNNLEHRLHHRHLHFSVGSCCGGQRWRSVDLNQPWLEVVFNQNIISVHLEAMLVVNNHGLNTFERDVYDVLYFVKAFISCVLTPSLLEVEPKVLDAPLRSMLRVVILRILLDGYVRQMTLHIVLLLQRIRVFLVTESCEP